MVIGCDIYQSGWPFDPTFPVFIANAISWYKNIHNQPNIITSDIARVQFFESVDNVKISCNGKNVNEQQIVANSVRFPQTKQLGIYEFVGFDNEGNLVETRNIAANIFSLDESNVTPIQEFKIKKQNVASREFLTINREIWPYLLLIAFFIVLGEWYLFHRRSISFSLRKKDNFFTQYLTNK